MYTYVYNDNRILIQLAVSDVVCTSLDIGKPLTYVSDITYRIQQLITQIQVCVSMSNAATIYLAHITSCLT